LKGGKEGVLGIALDVEKVIKKLQTGYLELRVKGIITVPISRISLLAGKLSRTYSSGQSLEDYLGRRQENKYKLYRSHGNWHFLPRRDTLSASHHRNNIVEEVDGD
jgi:hypothetical protein